MRRLAFLVVVLLVAACYQTPVGSIAPGDAESSTPSVTATPSSPAVSPSIPPNPPATPSPSEVPSIGPFPSETAAERSPCPGGSPAPGGFSVLEAAAVNVDALNLRDGPCRAGHLIAAPGLTNPVKRATLVIILGGPIAYGGYRWYPVGVDLGPEWVYPAAGWVAAGTTSDTWLRRVTPSCPTPSLDAIAGLSPIERLACYGSRSLTFTAHQAAAPPDAGFGGACEAAGLQAGWLICDHINYNFVNADGGPAQGPGMLKLFFDPSRGIKPLGLAPVGTTGPAYQISGHFSDVSAPWCSEGISVDSVDAFGAWLICETAFVVEDLQAIE